ncbi:MAG TPA: HAMP domain-containing sensor histidine kinase [Candidatus Deferrimicrobium sp.]|nr:HAMP domain-containing sensor histidine kinase [Candidatus Deferrimicrobium sp.]
MKPFLSVLLWLNCSTLALSVLSAETKSVDVIDIDADRDARFLPYAVDVLDQRRRSFDSKPVRHPRWVYTIARRPGDSAIILAAQNSSLTVDLPAMVEILQYPGNVALREYPPWLTVTDIGTVGTANHSGRAIWFAGFRKDSAWIHICNPTTNQRDSIFIATGEDHTGDGTWQCQLYQVACFDYDHDEFAEHFFYLNPDRDLQPRALLCIELESAKIEWSTPIASIVNINRVLPCDDSTGPGVIVCSYGPGQGSEDSVFSDSYGYLIGIDRLGTIVFSRIISRYADGTALLQDSGSKSYFLLHTLPFLQAYPADDTTRLPSMISQLDARGSVLRTMVAPERIAQIWLADFDDDSEQELYATAPHGVMRIYDQDLTLLAESKSGPVNYVGQIQDWDGIGPVFFFDEGSQVGVYTRRFEKLAVCPTHAYRDVFSLDGLEHVTGFLGADADGYFVAHIKTRSLWEMMTIVYVDNQKWVLAAMSSLLVGLLAVNFYRGRITRQKKELESTHKQLAEAHEALRRAQQTIIAQEKYRQAKDIAGGFAHEIRNALFPADSALTKMRALGDLAHADPGEVEMLQASILSAVVRAIDITKQISHYAKLESDYHPESVILKQVVDEVLKANRIRIDDAGVLVQVDGESCVAVAANAKQLYSVVNNLVLNSLDALTGRTNPTIMMEWSAAQGSVCISLSDNGIGISEQDLKRVFDAFFSTKPNAGTGLGLSVVKRIVEMYGGTVAVSSTLGEGTRFEIRLQQATSA